MNEPIPTAFGPGSGASCKGSGPAQTGALVGHSGGTSENFQFCIASDVCQHAGIFATLVRRLLNQCVSAFFPLMPTPNEILISQVYCIPPSVLGGEVTHVEIACSQ